MLYLLHGKPFTITQAAGGLGTRGSNNVYGAKWQGVSHLHAAFWDFSSWPTDSSLAEAAWAAAAGGVIPQNAAAFDPTPAANGTVIVSGGPSYYGKYIQKTSNLRADGHGIGLHFFGTGVKKAPDNMQFYMSYHMATSGPGISGGSNNKGTGKFQRFWVTGGRQGYWFGNSSAGQLDYADLAGGTTVVGGATQPAINYSTGGGLYGNTLPVGGGTWQHLEILTDNTSTLAHNLVVRYDKTTVGFVAPGTSTTYPYVDGAFPVASEKMSGYSGSGAWMEMPGASDYFHASAKSLVLVSGNTTVTIPGGTTGRGNTQDPIAGMTITGTNIPAGTTIVSAPTTSSSATIVSTIAAGSSQIVVTSTGGAVIIPGANATVGGITGGTFSGTLLIISQASGTVGGAGTYNLNLTNTGTSATATSCVSDQTMVLSAAPTGSGTIVDAAWDQVPSVVRYADIYADFTAQRVELVDSTGKFALQVLTSWVDNEIDGLANLGNLTPGLATLKVYSASDTLIFSQVVTIGLKICHQQLLVVDIPPGVAAGTKPLSAPLSFDDGNAPQNAISKHFSSAWPSSQTAYSGTTNMAYRVTPFTRTVGTNATAIDVPYPRHGPILGAGAVELGDAYHGANTLLAKNFTKPLGSFVTIARWWERTDPAWQPNFGATNGSITGGGSTLTSTAGSAVLAATTPDFTTTATFSTGASSITVASATGIVVGALVFGTGLGTSGVFCAVDTTYVPGSTTVPLKNLGSGLAFSATANSSGNYRFTCINSLALTVGSIIIDSGTMFKGVATIAAINSDGTVTASIPADYSYTGNIGLSDNQQKIFDWSGGSEPYAVNNWYLGLQNPLPLASMAAPRISINDDSNTAIVPANWTVNSSGSTLFGWTLRTVYVFHDTTAGNIQYFEGDSDTPQALNNPGATFQGYISGTTLTVTSISSGYIGAGQSLSATGSPVGLKTTNLSSYFLSGTKGGVGTYAVTSSTTLGSSGSPLTFTATCSTLDAWSGTTRCMAVGGFQRADNCDNNWRYFAGVYMDVGDGELWLTNSSSWSASTIREVQPWSVWNPTAASTGGTIRVNVNAGRHNTGDMVYMHLRNAPFNTQPNGDTYIAGPYVIGGPYDLAPATIIVVNSDVAQSLTDALDYCAKRSIPIANIRAFNFGTLDYFDAGVSMAGLRSTTANFWGSLSGSTVQTSCQNSNASLYGSAGTNPQPFYSSVLSGSLLGVLSNDVLNNGALCILCSTYTPSDVIYLASGFHPFPSICGQAVYQNNQSSTTYAPYGVCDAGLAPPANSLVSLAGTVIPPNWASLTTNRPHGRLGCSDFSRVSNGVTFAELTPKTGTSVYLTSVINALANEQTNNFSKSVWYSSALDNNYAGGISASSAYSQFISAVGLTSTYDLSLATNSSLISSTLSSPLPNIWAALLLNSFNGAGGYPSYWSTNVSLKANIDAGNLVIQPGAFGTSWYSYQANFGMALLYGGASAVIMTVGEPYSNVLSFGHSVFAMLIRQGVPLALANFWSPTTGASSSTTPINSGASVAGNTVYGDPLYAPYYVGSLRTISVTTDTNS